MSSGSDVRRHLLFSLAKVVGLLAGAAALLLVVLPRLGGDYGSLPLPDSRTVVWLVM